MATINDGELFLEAGGATEDQLRRGLAAARSVLAGVDLWAASDAGWKPEYIDDQGEGEMSATEWELNEVWWNAQRAAHEVIGVGEPSDTRICMWKAHLESERNFAETLKQFPDAKQVPPPDPGPHYTVKPEALLPA